MIWTEIDAAVIVRCEEHLLAAVPGAVGLACEPMDGASGWVCRLPATDSPDGEARIASLLGHLESRATVLADMIAGGIGLDLAVTGNVDTERSLNVDPDVLRRVARLGLGLTFTARTQTTNSEDELAAALGW